MTPALALPHRAPLLLIDSLLRVSAEAAVALVTVDPGAWYADSDGAMPAWFGLELMAQAAAAFNGHAGSQLGLAPATGYLIGTRSYQAFVARFAAGARLEVEARVDYPATLGQSAMICEIRCAGQVLALATLKFYTPPC